jgi:hypothetical protein
MSKQNKLTLKSLEDDDVLSSLDRLSLKELIRLSGQISVVIDRKCQPTQSVLQTIEEETPPVALKMHGAGPGTGNPKAKLNTAAKPATDFNTSKYIKVGEKVFRKKRAKTRSLEWKQAQNWLMKAREGLNSYKGPANGIQYSGLKLQLELAKEYSFLVRQNEKAGSKPVNVESFRKILKKFSIISEQDLKKARESIVNLIPLTINVSVKDALLEVPDTDQDKYISVYSDFLQHWFEESKVEFPKRNVRLYIAVDDQQRKLLKKQLLVHESSDADSDTQSAEGSTTPKGLGGNTIYRQSCLGHANQSSGQHQSEGPSGRNEHNAYSGASQGSMKNSNEST